MPGGGAKGLVEVGAEAALNRAAEELVGADALASAFLEGGRTDLPPMKVESQPPARHLGDAYGIESAGNRFGKARHLDCAKGRQ